MHKVATKSPKAQRFMANMAHSIGKKIATSIHKSMSDLNISDLVRNPIRKPNLLDTFKIKHMLNPEGFTKIFFSEMLNLNLAEVVIKKNFSKQLTEATKSKNSDIIYAIMQKLINQYTASPKFKATKISLEYVYKDLGLSKEAKVFFQKLQSYSWSVLDKMYDLSSEADRKTIADCLVKLDQRINDLQQLQYHHLNSLSSLELSDIMPNSPREELIALPNESFSLEKSFLLGDETICLLDTLNKPGALQAMRDNIMLFDLKKFDLSNRQGLLDNSQKELVESIKNAQAVVDSLLKQAIAKEEHKSAINFIKNITCGIINVVTNIFDKFFQIVSLGRLHLAWRIKSDEKIYDTKEIAGEAKKWVKSLDLEVAERTKHWVNHVISRRSCEETQWMLS